MEISQLMTEGVNLLIVGMGTVFVFLALMVMAVSLMSKLAQHIKSLMPTPAVDTLSGAPADHIAAISAAVRRYRARHSS